MVPRRFNIVTDLQYGSTGKGCIASYLTWVNRPTILSTTNMANAGHTAVNENGDKFIAKILPSPAICAKWAADYRPDIYIGPTAAFHLETFFKELKETCYTSDNIFIHGRAGVITTEQREREGSLEKGTKHLASTMQGCGAFLSDKVMRKQELKLARDYEELQPYLVDRAFNDDSPSMPMLLMRKLTDGNTLLHEGSQGFSLDISHGQGYPYCTSRSTTAMQNATDMGMPPSMLGRIYGVMRPYPIRVGNVIENGKVVGTSGGCYADQQEISWEDVAKAAGAPSEIAQNEYTTVTKRMRRVYTYSKRQMRESVAINGVTNIALNFANYIDWSCYGVNEYDRLSQKIKDFISKVEDDTGVPVTIVGTGPQLNHVCQI